ncbi:rhomboid family intramembrane serine protease [Candidatus Sumerlaeota bacterium]|nr:rhomboid family intramembrane serine protease [Candidatus Sumerlaeota bacterium]
MYQRNLWSELNFFLSRYLTPAVKYILLANTVVFLVQVFVIRLLGFKVTEGFFYLFAETPQRAIFQFMVWQFVTYMFIHGNVFHFLFNMIILWFFAPRLEVRWGTLGFVKFYFIVGIGAGLIHALVSIMTGRPLEGIIGASGALYGILLAYALYWPDDIVLVWGIIPVKVKVLVIVMGLFAFLGSVESAQTGISHITHLGGLIVAFLYLKGPDIWRRLRGRTRYTRSGTYRIEFSDRDFWR